MAAGILPHCVHCGAEIPIYHPRGRRKYCSDVCRMWAKVEKSDQDSCWLFTGPTTAQMGYGSTTVNGKTTGAHRVAYMAAFGEIPQGLYVCHRCDNPRCCNPSHLFLGTPQDNVDDMLAKGRLPVPTLKKLTSFLAMRATPEFEEKRRLSTVGRKWTLSPETRARMKQLAQERAAKRNALP